MCHHSFSFPDNGNVYASHLSVLADKSSFCEPSHSDRQPDVVFLFTMNHASNSLKWKLTPYVCRKEKYVFVSCRFAQSFKDISTMNGCPISTFKKNNNKNCSYYWSENYPVAQLTQKLKLKSWVLIQGRVQFVYFTVLFARWPVFILKSLVVNG